MLRLSYWTFTLLGILASSVQVILTFYLLYKYILRSNTCKKLEYQLIMFRVFLDALIGIGGLTYFLSSIRVLLYPEEISFDVYFLIAISNSHFLDMRSFLAAIIAIERVLAVTVPLGFYKYRKKVSNCPIFVFIIFTGFAAYITLFGICDLRLPLDPKCTDSLCAIPPCYRNYVVLAKIVYSCTNIFFSLLLCYMLFWLYWKRTQVPADIRRLNWLSLTDGLTTLLFDLLPSLMINAVLVSTNDLGPVIGSFRHVARAVEAAVMVKLMKKKQVVVNKTSGSFRINAICPRDDNAF